MFFYVFLSVKFFTKWAPGRREHMFEFWKFSEIEKSNSRSTSLKGGKTMTHKSGGVDEDSNFARYALGRDFHSGHLALPHIGCGFKG